MQKDQIQDVVQTIRALTSSGRSLDDACRMLSGMNVNDALITRARAEYERFIGIVTALDYPRSFTNKGHEKWYAGPDKEHQFWPPLRRLLESKHDLSVVESIDAASTKIVSLLPPPSKRSFDSKGLVLGYVQSGKTANYTAVAAKAADVGYRLIIVLSGVHNILRRQTQSRIQKELKDLNPDKWFSLTTTDDDFQTTANASAFLADPGQKRVMLVVKKNTHVLQRLKEWLRSAGKNVLASCPVLIIDDEADAASINTGTADDRSAINRHIVEIVELLPRIAYVGYTATPFANVLVDPSYEDDLYPRDFIVDLPRPDGYFGPERLFGREPLSQDESGTEFEGLDMIRTIPDDHVSALQPASRKELASFRATIPASLTDSIRYFWLASSARRARGQYDEHSSMLVHTSMLVAMHQQVAGLIEEYRSYALSKLGDEHSSIWQQLRDDWSIELAKGLWNVLDRPETSFEELQPHLRAVIADTQVITENGQSEDRLEYGDEPSVQIVVGGNTLSRGLTLEGLIVSYFIREAKAYDTLLQMGRWFGYRPGYEDLPRIWMTRELEGWFADLATVEAEIRQDIARYDAHDLTPRDFAVQIRQHPQIAITSPLKMRAAVDAKMNYSEKTPQTVRFDHRCPGTLDANIQAARNLIVGILRTGKVPIRSADGGKVAFPNVSVTQVLQFIAEYQFHKDDLPIQAHRLRSYISEQNEYSALRNWAVALVGRAKGDDRDEFAFAEGIKVPLISRSRLPHNDEYAYLKAIKSPQDPEAVDSLLEGEMPDGTRPQLLIYPIHKDSQPASENSHRTALGAIQHLIGVTFVFPKAERNSPVNYVSVPLPDTEYMEDEEDE